MRWQGEVQDPCQRDRYGRTHRPRTPMDSIERNLRELRDTLEKARRLPAALALPYLFPALEQLSGLLDSIVSKLKEVEQCRKE